MDGFDASGELSSFLRERRLQLRPEDVGLPRRPPRGRGLRRQELAELLDVSPLWYALFESGASGRRFSGAFLERVQRVLHLDHAERGTFLKLVVTSGHASPDIEAEWYNSRLESVAIEIADALRRINAASTLESAVDLAGASLITLLAELRHTNTLEPASALP